MGVEAYPLHWPDGWPRTQPYNRIPDHRFHGKSFRFTMGRVRDQLFDELRLLGAKGVVLSTNVELRLDGLPYSETRHIADPGVATYFMLDGEPLIMARDQYITVAGNIRTLTLAIGHLRGLERHGGRFMMRKAFGGFKALPSPDGKKPWREVFGLTPDWRGNINEVTALFRVKAKDRHPDAGGSDTLMAELNIALREARDELESKAA
jgi:hypothetical protein